MMTFIKKVLLWLVFSSKNSAKISLTIKAALTGLVTVATIYAGIANVSLPTEALTQAVDGIITFVQTALVAISSAVTAWGLIRKIWRSFTGDNHVINTLPE